MAFAASIIADSQGKQFVVVSGCILLIARQVISPQLYVPHALVSIAGGIQPEIVDRALESKHRESDMAARFLFAYPPKRPKKWNESSISSGLDAQMSYLFNRLYDMKSGDKKISSSLFD